MRNAINQIKDNPDPHYCERGTADDGKLTPVIVEDPSCPAPRGDQIVARQSLAPGDVPIHSTVELTVCTGKP